MQTNSPSKRMKMVATATATATAAAAITSELGLLENIIGFLPTADPEQDATSSTTPAVVLQTIATLCRAIPGLSQHVGPANEAFWRTMVLAHFDFATDGTSFNIEDVNEIARRNIPDAFHYGQEGAKPADWTAWCRNPAKEPLDAWTAAHPDVSRPNEFFDEAYAQWATLGILFRPSQYGFLQQIQTDRSVLETAWPTHERAFSLFCDLVVLQKLVRPEYSGFQTYSDGEQFLSPCLLSRLDVDLSEDDSKMMQHCGFLPHYWNGCPGVGTRWTGFGGPVPSVTVRDVNEDEDPPERDEYETKEELGIFPLCGARDFVDLRRLAYDSFDDWRRIRMNQDEETGPEFYIGKSKKSGRWMGLVGQSDYASSS